MSRLIQMQGIALVADIMESTSPAAWAQSFRNIESTFDERRENGQPEAFIDGCKLAISQVRPHLKQQAED